MILRSVLMLGKHVLLHITLLGRPVVAERALERFFAGVGEHVSLQMRVAKARVGAQRARKLSRGFVRDHVVLVGGHVVLHLR